MCTVSFVPLKNGFCLTSNRDEKTTRQRAIPPTKYIINNKEIYFPKDPKAGGTWFAHDNKNTIVLLNGAKEKHVDKQSYKKSRGIIVLDLITSNDIILEWDTINLEDIEPFTIVLFTCDKLYELQWDETEKKNKELDINAYYIWSSSTLYSKEIRNERARWFSNFMDKENEINADKLLKFHQFTEGNNKKYGLQIERENNLKTVSITQCQIVNNQPNFNYIDLLD
ncbi:NRDE family protein [Flavobacterium sp.]|uniref:NRDE family protein n=1 Tax=Flavobacterium sp. TaxID=239 RepID=UPI003F69AAF6